MNMHSYKLQVIHVQSRVVLVLVVVALDMACVPLVPRCVHVTVTGRVLDVRNQNVMAIHTCAME